MSNRDGKNAKKKVSFTKQALGRPCQCGKGKIEKAPCTNKNNHKYCLCCKGCGWVNY